jgi:hypothetical protein
MRPAWAHARACACPSPRPGPPARGPSTSCVCPPRVAGGKCAAPRLARGPAALSRPTPTRGAPVSGRARAREFETRPLLRRPPPPAPSLPAPHPLPSLPGRARFLAYAGRRTGSPSCLGAPFAASVARLNRPCLPCAACVSAPAPCFQGGVLGPVDSHRRAPRPTPHYPPCARALVAPRQANAVRNRRAPRRAVPLAPPAPAPFPAPRPRVVAGGAALRRRRRPPAPRGPGAAGTGGAERLRGAAAPQAEHSEFAVNLGWCES